MFSHGDTRGNMDGKHASYFINLISITSTKHPKFLGCRQNVITQRRLDQLGI